MIFITAMAKLPLTEALHPGGGELDGAMEAVTACGLATGDAFTAAAKASAARVYRIMKI